MRSQIAIATLLSLFVFAITPVTVLAHSGGLDGHGCHHDRNLGGYHCHKGPMAGKFFASKQEMLASLETLNQQLKHFPIMVSTRRSGQNTPNLLFL
jgi:hypothetical protein